VEIFLLILIIVLLILNLIITLIVSFLLAKQMDELAQLWESMQVIERGFQRLMTFIGLS